MTNTPTERDLEWLADQKQGGHCGEGNLERGFRRDHNERIDRLLSACRPTPVEAEAVAWGYQGEFCGLWTVSTSPETAQAWRDLGIAVTSLGPITAPAPTTTASDPVSGEGVDAESSPYAEENKAAISSLLDRLGGYQAVFNAICEAARPGAVGLGVSPITFAHYLLSRHASALFPTAKGGVVEAVELIANIERRMWNEYMADECCDYVKINGMIEELHDALAALQTTASTPGVTDITDEMVERAARAHDAEESAQKGEPSPWTHYNCDDGSVTEADCPDCKAFRDERLSTMRIALTAALAVPAKGSE